MNLSVVIQQPDQIWVIRTRKEYTVSQLKFIVFVIDTKEEYKNPAADFNIMITPLSRHRT